MSAAGHAGTETENPHLLCQEVARQGKGDRKIIQTCGKKKTNHCNWTGNPTWQGEELVGKEIRQT